MIVTAIVDDAALAALVPAWTELWARAAAPSSFAHPAWLMAWWRQFGTGRPLVATLRQGDKLYGVLPCYRLETAAGMKVLPIGVSLSDTHDVLVAPGAPEMAATLLLHGVLAGADGAICDLVDLPPDALLRHAVPPLGWRVTETPGEPCPVLAIGAGEPVPAMQRRKLRMNRHRADRLGGWAFAFDNANELDRLFAWQRARRDALGDIGLDALAAAFLRDAAPGLHAAGRLRLATLQIAGVPAAACLVLAAPGRLLLYMSGFAERFAACSPGTLLLGALIDAAAREGVREVHFLRGGERYKYAWGGIDRHNIARRFERQAWPIA